MRKFGLADGLGIVGALVAVMYLPGQADPLTYPKLFVLVAGGLFLAPVVIQRWRSLQRPAWGVWVVCGAIVGILGWGLVSLVASGAPWAVSLFGWWGRGDGWLAWLGAAILLLGAATLTPREAQRTVTWLLGGAAVVGVVGVLQVLGVDWPQSGFPNQATGFMGNINFSAAYFAMLGVLAFGRAISRVALWQRIAAGVIFLVFAILAVITDSQQGEVALAAGILTVGISAAILYRGRHRIYGLIASAVVVVVALALLAASFAGIGPLTRLWSETTFDIRQEYWQSAINIMNGLPVFGTGPDGFARYVAEYRPESYVELLGPVLRVSAAHNIALQFGAVIGWVGLILWVIGFLGAALLLFIRIVRPPVASIGFTASALGALVAYLVQGMVSIDMLPLLATGWLIMGLAVAAAREPLPQPETPSEEAPAKSRKEKVIAAVAARKSAEAPTPVAALSIGGALALVGAVLVGVQMAAANATTAIQTQEQAVEVSTSALTPCPPRVNVMQQVLQQLPAEVAVPTLNQATALDPRCAPMITFQADIALQQGDLQLADAATQQSIEFDPLLATSWTLRGRYHVAVGDLAAAEADLVEAERVNALYPDPEALQEQIDGLRAEIEAAR